MYRESNKEYFELQAIPSQYYNPYSPHYEPCSTSAKDTVNNYHQAICVRLTDKQIIAFLEDKIVELEKVLSKLENYCGKEYIEACKELELFITTSNIKQR